jgi:hypothetical protein
MGESKLDYEIEMLEKVILQMYQCLAIFLLSDDACEGCVQETLIDIKILKAELSRLNAEKDADIDGVLSKRSGKVIFE